MTTVTKACLATLALLTLGVGVPHADAGLCAAAKLQATGKRTAGELACWARARAKGIPIDPSCLGKVAQGFATVFAKAEAKGGCAVTGDTATIAASVADAIAAIVDALGGPGPSACTKRKLLAAGKKAAAKYGCVAKAVKKVPEHGIDPTCLHKAEIKFSQAFLKAEAKRDCLAGVGNDPTIEALVDGLLGRNRATMAPPLTTCAPIDATVLHGDGFLGNNRLAKIVKGKVPCVHGEDMKATKCRFSTIPGRESGIWLESPAGNFAKTGQGISKDGLPNGDYVIAADRTAGPPPCLEPTGMDTSGRTEVGIELNVTCTVEDGGLATNNVLEEGYYLLRNWADGIVCSADETHPDGAPYVGDGGFGAGVYCYTGAGAALNDINGTERDPWGVYYPGERSCHYLRVDSYEVVAAKRPSTVTLPVPGRVVTDTRILWRPVSGVKVANFGTPAPLPTPTPTGHPAASATPTATATPTPTPDYLVDTALDDPALAGCAIETVDDCSLRGVMIKAATRIAPTRIALPAGTYVLTATADCYHATGQFGAHTVYDTTSLCLAGTITLVGEGAASTIIDGNASDRTLLIGNAGPVRLESVTIRGGHQAGGSLFGGGGGINSGGDLTLADCVITDNAAEGKGGGIYSSGTLAIERCTVSANTASTGGGIHTDSFFAPVNATITDTAIVDNESTGEPGGGVFIFSGNAGGVTTIRGSTIARNTATATSGGGLYIGGLDGTLVVTNSTISGNRAGWYYGGGLHVGARSAVQLRNVTVTGNRSEDATGTQGAGGGIAAAATGTFTLANTIVAGNTAPSFAPDCYDGGASFVSDGYNLIGTQGGPDQGGSYCDLSAGAVGDTVGEDPLLGPLADNGGPTETHAPVAGSPAIDTGDPAGCTEETASVLTVDQRGAPRPVDGDGDDDARCDRGAVESP